MLNISLDYNGLQKVRCVWNTLLCCLYASIIIAYFTSLVTQKETYKWSTNHAELGSEIRIFDCNPTEGVRIENGNAVHKACMFEWYAF